MRWSGWFRIDGTWTHLEGTFDHEGKTVVLWVNGKGIGMATV